MVILKASLGETKENRNQRVYIRRQNNWFSIKLGFTWDEKNTFKRDQKKKASECT